MKFFRDAWDTFAFLAAATSDEAGDLAGALAFLFVACAGIAILVVALKHLVWVVAG